MKTIKAKISYTDWLLYYSGRGEIKPEVGDKYFDSESHKERIIQPFDEDDYIELVDMLKSDEYLDWFVEIDLNLNEPIEFAMFVRTLPLTVSGFIYKDKTYGGDLKELYKQFKHEN